MSETELGREPVTIIEIDQLRCANTYGLTPCQAQLGVTGTQKCFNTFNSCQDRENYNDQASPASTLTLRFCKPMVQVPLAWRAIPSLATVNSIASRINPAGADDMASPLGEASRLQFTLQDHPDGDVLTDPYLSTRDYNPAEQGTFWGKWLARNPYYQNFEVRIREGYLGQELSDMRVRYFLLDKIAGPDSLGKVNFTAISPMRLFDEKRAQAPMPSEGTLAVDFNDDSTDTSIIITGASLTDYDDPLTGDPSGTVRIGDECLTFTGRHIDNGFLILTGITRATDNTQIDDHESGAKVQLCLRYTSQAGYLIAQSLIDDFSEAGVFRDQEQWTEEGGTWLAQFTGAGIITEPTPIADLLAELCRDFMFFIFYDERAQRIKIKALRPPVETPSQWNEQNHILQNSQTFKVATEERISELWVYYNLLDPTQDLEKTGNFANILVNPVETNPYAEEKVKAIFSRWLNDTDVVQQLAGLYMKRYKDNPIYLTVMVDAKDRSTWLGDVVDIDSSIFQNSVGANAPRRFLVISAEEPDAGHTAKYELKSYDLLGRFSFYMADDAPVFTEASFQEKTIGGFYSDENGFMSDGSAGYTYQ